jgi:hypothetical protein
MEGPTEQNMQDRSVFCQYFLRKIVSLDGFYESKAFAARLEFDLNPSLTLLDPEVGLTVCKLPTKDFE